MGMNCDRVSHLEQSDQTEEGDEMSTVQISVQHATDKGNPDHQAREPTKNGAKHEADEKGAMEASRVNAIEKEGDFALQESSGEVRTIKEEEDAFLHEGFGDRKAREYLKTLARYEA